MEFSAELPLSAGEGSFLHSFFFFLSPKSKIRNPKSEVDDKNLVGDFDAGGDTTVISATTDLVSLSDELPDLSNALGERNRTYTDTSPLGVNPYRQGLI